MVFSLFEKFKFIQQIELFIKVFSTKNVWF